jgi:hypothetical protein
LGRTIRFEPAWCLRPMGGHVGSHVVLDVVARRRDSMSRDWGDLAVAAAIHTIAAHMPRVHALSRRGAFETEEVRRSLDGTVSFSNRTPNAPGAGRPPDASTPLCTRAPGDLGVPR